MPRIPIKDDDYYEVNNNNCWIFKGGLCKGYGVIERFGKTMSAHRYFYIKYKGNIQNKLQIDHLCRNTKCVNPEHLEVVTHTENMRRIISNKISKELSDKIRILYKKSDYSQREIGLMYDVHQSHISRIISNKRWNLSKI